MNREEEKRLIGECLAGKQQSQELLYQQYCRKMMGICMRYMQNREDAEDILQEAFVRVFNKLEKFESRGSLEGWIRRIVLNTIFESFRKMKLVFITQNDSLEEIADEEDAVFSQVSVQDLVKMIQELPPAYRAVFNLFAVEGFTHKEIAELLGISEGTSKSNYSAARRKLQIKFSQINQVY